MRGRWSGIKFILLDTSFLLPFFGLDLGELNDFVRELYIRIEKLFFAEISIYEVKFKLISLFRKGKVGNGLLREFWDNFSVLRDDTKIEFIGLDEEIDSTINDIEANFRSLLGVIDEIIVATAVKVGYFLTLDERILKTKKELEKRYNIRIYTMKDFLKLR